MRDGGRSGREGPTFPERADAGARKPQGGESSPPLPAMPATFNATCGSIRGPVRPLVACPSPSRPRLAGLGPRPSNDVLMFLWCMAGDIWLIACAGGPLAAPTPLPGRPPHPHNPFPLTMPPLGCNAARPPRWDSGLPGAPSWAAWLLADSMVGAWWGQCGDTGCGPVAYTGGLSSRVESYSLAPSGGHPTAVGGPALMACAAARLAAAPDRCPPTATATTAQPPPPHPTPATRQQHTLHGGHLSRCISIAWTPSL